MPGNPNDSILNEQGVQVTRNLVEIDQTTHQIANIVSVRVQEDVSTVLLGVLIAIAGLVLLVSKGAVAQKVQWGAAGPAALCVLTGSIMFKFGHTWELYLTTAAGNERPVLRSRDKDRVTRVAAAIKRAMAERG